MATVSALGIAALMAPGGAAAKSSKDGHAKRAFYATDAAGKLVRFAANKPGKDARRSISGLPAGVTVTGIDFRPATGDLYGVGSDSVVYRVNPSTAIAVAEAPAFSPALAGGSFGVDFNPVPDRIRLTSNTGQNLRLHPDDGNVVGEDTNLNPGMPQIVGSAYTNSSFRAAKPTMTTLYALDAGTDALCVQNPPNAGTLTGCKSVTIDIGLNTGFDIAGSDSKNVGFVATTAKSGSRSGLWRLNLTTGKTRYLGRIGEGKAAITGLAAVQDVR
jgi:hypothetical protein